MEPFSITVMQDLISVHSLYAILGVFSILCAFAILLFKKDKRRVHWLILVALAFWGLRMNIYAMLFNPATTHFFWAWPIYLIVSMAYGPLFFLFATELSDIKGFQRSQLLVFLPMAIMSVFLILVYSLPDPEYLQRVHDCAICKTCKLEPNENILISTEYVCYYVFRMIIFWFEAGILIWSSWCITQYEKTVNEYFSSHEGKSITQAKTIAILTAFIVIVVIIRETIPNYDQRISPFKLILILVSFLFQLFMTIMAFNIEYTADDIRRLLEADDNTGNRNRGGYDDNHQGAIATCWKKLEDMMNDNKVFLEPDLNLIDLSQRLGTNRTYMSQAIKQFSGSSFSDYVNQARINFAKQLLLNGEALKNVEYSCGYVSTSTFYRQFQKQVGMAPTVWLEQQRLQKINK